MTQSPQFYKQMMVSSFERVFEVGKVYRAEGFNTSRHLTEFTGLDFEMGFIESVYDIMDMEEKCLFEIFQIIKNNYSKELEQLNVELNWNGEIPRITYFSALEIVKNYGLNSLNAEAEHIIGEYIKETTNSDFVFITNYPLCERPFYAMPSENGLSETFDLLYKGVEITSGGQRIHLYEPLVEAIRAKGFNPESFEDYLMPFKYGIPPHGGMGIGLERLVKQMLNLNSITESSLIPRTKNKIRW